MSTITSSIFLFISAFLLTNGTAATLRGTIASNNKEVSRRNNKLVASSLKYNLNGQTINMITTTSFLSQLESIAQKYNCASGEKNIETIVDEVMTKNTQTRNDLEKRCQKKHEDLELKRISKQTYATELLTNATNDANTVYGMDSAAANSKLETIEQHHASAVAALLATKTEMEKKHLKASNTFQSSVVKYNNTKKSLASRHVAELARYAAEETRVSKAEASTVQTALLSQVEKTNFANTTKTNNLESCVKNNNDIQKILKADRESIVKIKVLQEKLETLKSRMSGSTSDSFLEVHISLRDNYDEMLEQNLNTQQEWASCCSASFASYDNQLLSQTEKVKEIRDNTEHTNTGIYNDEVSAANEKFNTVDASQQALVTAAEKHVSTKQQAKSEAEVTLQKTSTSYKAAKEMADIDTLKLKASDLEEKKTSQKYTNMSVATLSKNLHVAIDDAQDDKTTSISQCKAVKATRSEILNSDVKLVNEIQPLLLKLTDCQSKTADTSLLDVSSKVKLATHVSCAHTNHRLKKSMSTAHLITPP
jgi:hypothetical protein